MSHEISLIKETPLFIGHLSKHTSCLRQLFNLHFMSDPSEIVVDDLSLITVTFCILVTFAEQCNGGITLCCDFEQTSLKRVHPNVKSSVPSNCANIHIERMIIFIMMWTTIDPSRKAYNASDECPTSARFCYKMVHCEIWDWSIVGFVRWVYAILID